MKTSKMTVNLQRILQPAHNLFKRTLHLSRPTWGDDVRDKRRGHVAKSDKVEGEYESAIASKGSFELIDDNLMNRVFGSLKYKDIPIVFIRCTRNNTKVTLTRGDGKVECARSAGLEGFKNCRKGTTVAAQAVANRVVTYANDHDINTIRLVFNGLGPGRNAAYKVIELSGLNVVSLSDRTEAIEPWILRPRKAKRL